MTDKALWDLTELVHEFRKEMESFEIIHENEVYTYQELCHMHMELLSTGWYRAGINIDKKEKNSGL